MEQRMTREQAHSLLREIGTVIRYSDPGRFAPKRENSVGTDSDATVIASALITGGGGHVFTLPPKRTKPR